MTNFEKMRMILDAGHLAMCEDEDGDFAVVRFGTSDGVWMSDWSDTRYEALQELDGGPYSPSEINALTLEIQFIQIECGYEYEPGEQVMIAKGLQKWDNQPVPSGVPFTVLGKVGTNMYNVLVDGRLYETDTRNMCPARVFEEETKETIMIGGKTYEVSDELKIALAKLREVEI